MAVPGEYDTMPTRIALIVQATMMRTSTITFVCITAVTRRVGTYLDSVLSKLSHCH